MSSVRVTVEHSYKDIKQYWMIQDFDRMLKARKAPIALLYRSSCLLINIKKCLYEREQVQHQYRINWARQPSRSTWNLMNRTKVVAIDRSAKVIVQALTFA